MQGSDNLRQDSAGSIRVPPVYYRGAPYDHSRPEAVQTFYEKRLGMPAFVVPRPDDAGGRLDLNVYAPTSGRPFWVAATVGMSGRAMNVPPQAWRTGTPVHAELVALLPRNTFAGRGGHRSDADLALPEAWPMRFVRMLADMPRRLDGWLDYGHTIPAPDPAEAGEFHGAVMMPPIGLFAKKDHTIQAPEDAPIRLLSPVFLHLDEMEYQTRHGFPALAHLLQDRGVTALLRPHRWSVVANPWWRFW